LRLLVVLNPVPPVWAVNRKYPAWHYEFLLALPALVHVGLLFFGQIGLTAQRCPELGIGARFEQGWTVYVDFARNFSHA